MFIYSIIQYSVNVKRTWVDYGKERRWLEDSQGQGEEFLYHSVQVSHHYTRLVDPGSFVKKSSDSDPAFYKGRTR